MSGTHCYPTLSHAASVTAKDTQKITKATEFNKKRLTKKHILSKEQTFQVTETCLTIPHSLATYK